VSWATRALLTDAYDALFGAGQCAGRSTMFFNNQEEAQQCKHMGLTARLNDIVIYGL
jgi:hypothetical protein